MSETKQIERRKIVVMATFPPRKQSMLSRVKDLSPQCDELLIWLNEYNEIPVELREYKNVKCTLSKNINLKSGGKLMFIDEYKSDYYIPVDDDIVYPASYVHDQITNLDNYGQNVIVCRYGEFVKTQKNNIVQFHYAQRLENDTQCHVVGTGTVCFIPEKIGFKQPTIDELKDKSTDYLLSRFASENNIRCICLKRNANYLKDAIEGNTNFTTIGALHLCKEFGAQKTRDVESYSGWKNI